MTKNFFALLGLLLAVSILSGCAGNNLQTVTLASTPEQIGDINPEKNITVLPLAKTHDLLWAEAGRLACICRQLQKTTNGRQLVNAGFEDFRAGYREGQYVAGTDLWEQNSLVGLGLTGIKHILEFFANNGIDIDTATFTCNKVLSSSISVETARVNLYKSKLGLAVDANNIDANLTSNIAQNLCKQGLSEYCLEEIR